jgi:hypothetical protein
LIKIEQKKPQEDRTDDCTADNPSVSLKQTGLQRRFLLVDTVHESVPEGVKKHMRKWEVL